MYTLYNADCFAILETLPQHSVDLLLSDMPYNITDCPWETAIDLPRFWQLVDKVMKPNGAIVLTASSIFVGVLMMSNPKHFKYSWIWQKDTKTNFLNVKKQPLRTFEEVLVFYKKQPTYNAQMTEGKPYVNSKNKSSKYYSDTQKQEQGAYGRENGTRHDNQGTRYPVDLLTFPSARTADKSLLHPTQKPIALMEYMIKTYTNEGDTVLDCFMGSGTTGVACKKINREFIGVELNKEYFDVAQARIESA